MELIMALVLFTGLIGCWLILPGSTSTISVVSEQAPREVQSEARGALQQAA